MIRDHTDRALFAVFSWEFPHPFKFLSILDETLLVCWFSGLDLSQRRCPCLLPVFVTFGVILEWRLSTALIIPGGIK